MSGWLLLILLPLAALIVTDWRRTLRRTRCGTLDFTGHRFETRSYHSRGPEADRRWAEGDK